MDLKKYKLDKIENKHMLKLSSYSKEEILAILALAIEIKEKRAKWHRA